ncbi:aminotransferase class IV [Streptomyces sp. NPDC018584]|uniref:aminotransferase class IV n=1 Tax=unclassified Streptomyces TaxID=2593676 RepID=UPI0037A9BCB1
MTTPALLQRIEIDGLFGRGLDGERVGGLIRHILRGDPGGASAIDDASVRVHVHAPEGEPSLMVTVRPPTVLPAAMADRALALMSVPYQRPFAHIKHLGGFGQARYGELARRAGFDDALLTGPDGQISEGAVTNIAFCERTPGGRRTRRRSSPTRGASARCGASTPSRTRSTRS